MERFDFENGELVESSFGQFVHIDELRELIESLPVNHPHPEVKMLIKSIKNMLLNELEDPPLPLPAKHMNYTILKGLELPTRGEE